MPLPADGEPRCRCPWKLKKPMTDKKGVIHCDRCGHKFGDATLGRLLRQEAQRHVASGQHECISAHADRDMVTASIRAFDAASAGGTSDQGHRFYRELAEWLRLVADSVEEVTS